jgi:GNAT superfamily N-acetyltransferase
VAGHYADGSLPAPGVYGVPDAWPHVRSAYERAGFVHEGTIELILVACVDTLRPPSPEPPVPGLVARRSIGINGTRFTAFLGDEQVGYIEVEIRAGAERLARFGEWADIGDLQVDEVYPRRDVATWLFGKVVEWLHLARIDRLLAYAWPEQSERLDLYRHLGFVELVRTARGWSAEPTS